MHFSVLSLVSKESHWTKHDLRPTPRWKPPTAYTAAFGQHSAMMSVAHTSNSKQPTSSLQHPTRPKSAHRNFRQLRLPTEEIFDAPATFGAGFFSTAPHLRSQSAASFRPNRGPATDAPPALLPNHPQPVSDGHDLQQPAGGGGGAAEARMALLRERYCRDNARDRFNSEFYHRDPLYVRHPGPEPRFERCRLRDRQLQALFTAQRPASRASLAGGPAPGRSASAAHSKLCS
jgi:hypothetical protein